MTELTPDQIRSISRDAAKEVIADAAAHAAKQVAIDHEELRELVKESVHETLVQVGVAPGEPIEMQRDFQHLRDWRVASEGAKRKTIMMVIGVLVSGALGLLWLGFKEFMKQ